MTILFALYSLLLPAGWAWGFYQGYRLARGVFVYGDIDRGDLSPKGVNPPESREERQRIEDALAVERYGAPGGER